MKSCCQLFLFLLLLSACSGQTALPSPAQPTAAPAVTSGSALAAGPTVTAVASPLAAPSSTESYPAPQASEAQPTAAESYPAPPTVEAPPAAAYPAPATSAAETPTQETAIQATLAPPPFDGQRAFQDLTYQMSLGPRTPGSQAHAQVIEWMKSELAKNGWTVETQDTTQNGQPVHNVIAKRGSGTPWTILGAHFDSRMKADHDSDPAKRNDPVPGADDGASGVVVLMELSRTLPKDLKGQVWLAFFDSEDQGELPGWDWILGSRALANSLTGKPDAVIVIDMIGDANLNIFKERNSNPTLTDQIWNTAARLGYAQSFIPQLHYSMLDDHTPFLEKGIPAVDIIDFDYPYWHTTEDTADKTSAQSLKIVGDTLWAWLVH